MGYRMGRKVYRITFEDKPGLEVKAHGVSIGRLMGLVELASLAGGGFKPEDIAKLDDLFAVFAGALVSWNLEDEDGTPIGLDPAAGGDPAAARLDAVKSLDTDFVLEMVLAWMDAVVSVSAPLKPTSSGGDQFPAASLPMVDL